MNTRVTATNRPVATVFMRTRSRRRRKSSSTAATPAGEDANEVRRSGVQHDEGVVRVVQLLGTSSGGDHDVLQPHAPPSGHIDAGLDAVGVSGFEREDVALHDVRVLMFVEADAVAGPVDEVLPIACIGDDATR